MKTWYVQRGAETVAIFDSLDAQGNGNVRFRGTIEAALTHMAFCMQEADEARARAVAAEEEVARLKVQLDNLRR